MPRPPKACMVVLLLSSMAGCSRSELYAGVTEREANKMVAVIDAAGLHADKTTSDGKTWSVSVQKSDFPRAIQLLEESNIPRDKFDNLGDLFKKQGLVSSPVEEQARLSYGVSQELSDTISRINGVVDARVQVALPTPDDLGGPAPAPSASVLVQYDPAVDLSSQIDAIKGLVANGVQGLPADRITVVLTPVRSLTLASSPLGHARLPPAAYLLGAGIMILAGLAAALWFNRPIGRLLPPRLR